jgi:hypothetical protein
MWQARGKLSTLDPTYRLSHLMECITGRLIGDRFVQDDHTSIFAGTLFNSSLAA